MSKLTDNLRRFTRSLRSKAAFTIAFPLILGGLTLWVSLTPHGVEISTNQPSSVSINQPLGQAAEQ